MSNLSPEQRDAALHKFNAESCTCGCKFTLAQCRIYDAACQTSQKRTAEIIKGLSKTGKTSNNQKTQSKSPLPPNPKALTSPRIFLLSVLCALPLRTLR